MALKKFVAIDLIMISNEFNVFFDATETPPWKNKKIL
jgi:hypothetical protein